MTKTALFLLASVFTLSSHAQGRTSKGYSSNPKDKDTAGNGKSIIIEFNSVNKSFELKSQPKYVGEGGSIDIVIKDFNPFLYNVSIVERQGVYQNNEKLSEKTTPSLSYSQLNFNIKDLSINTGSVKLARKEFTSKDLENLGKEISAITTQIFNKTMEIGAKLSAFEQNINSRQTGKTFSPEDSSKAEADIIMARRGLDSLKEIKQYKEKQLDWVGRKTLDITDKLILYNNRVESFVRHLKSLNNISAYYRTLMNTVTVDGLDFRFANQRKMENFRAYFPEWDSTKKINISVYLNTLLQNLQDNFIVVSSYYNDISFQYLDDTTKESLKQNFQKIEAIYGGINFENYSRLVDFIDKLYLAINENMFTVSYSTKIIDDDADLIFFEITATPVASIDNGVPLQPSKFNFSIPIKGGAKIDIASGIVFNLGLKDKSYRYEKQTNGNYKVVENNNHSLFNPTVVLMAHLYRRNAIKNHRPNLCFGIGTSDAERLRYYLGMSWIIGRKQRLNLCGGIVGGQVNYADETVLNKELVLSEEELTKPIPFAKPAPFRIGGFFGITFNLTGSNSAFAQKLGTAK